MSTYLYVVARDFGFAPNPFNGVCTLATCKPRVRSGARVGDWVVGMGGKQLAAVGRCVFAMRVTSALSFDEYWRTPAFRCKRPVRNGSTKVVLGDNVYHRAARSGTWVQEDCHHSRTDGSPDLYNVRHDTRVDRVLVSEHFYYFGRSAPLVPTELLAHVGYRNGRNHRKFTAESSMPLISWIEGSFGSRLCQVMADPYQFEDGRARFSQGTNKVLR